MTISNIAIICFSCLSKKAWLLKTTLHIITLTASIILSMPATAVKPATLNYTVSMVSDKLGNATLGNLETVITETEQGGYQVSSNTKAQGLAAILLGSNFFENCEFNVSKKQIQAMQYSGGSGKSIDYQVSYDWEQRKIHFNDGESLDMPNGYIVDNCNFSLAAAISEGLALGKDTIYVVDGKKKRIRGYNLKSLSEESIETDLGELKTLKIVLEREFREGRTFTFWLANGYSFLPVKMEEKRKSRVSTMLVNKLEIK